jgi:hypothetical protein
MVLNEGGPCIVLKKNKVSGAMEVCGKTRDHLWYAGPSCKGCYEKANRKKRKQGEVATGVPMDLEDVLEENQETLVAIEEIYGSRCPATPSPSPTPFLCAQATAHCLLLTRALLLVRLTQPHRFSKIPRERRERRNPLEADEKVLEYDIYGQFEYERENGKKGKAEWGRRWCQVSECAGVEDWGDNLKAYEMELKSLREEAQETFEDE